MRKSEVTIASFRIELRFCPTAAKEILAVNQSNCIVPSSWCELWLAVVYYENGGILGRSYGGTPQLAIDAATRNLYDRYAGVSPTPEIQHP